MLFGDRMGAMVSGFNGDRILWVHTLIRRAIVGSKRAGLSSAVLDWLDRLGRGSRVDEAFCYITAVLNAPSYTERFWKAIEVDDLRVPLTNNPQEFDVLAGLGGLCREAWLSLRDSKPGLAWKGNGAGSLGKAEHAQIVEEGTKMSVPAAVFANGRHIQGVTKAMWDFEVSGYRVLPRWFAARSHWILTGTNSLQALRTVIAVSDLIDLQPQLDKALERLLTP